MSLHYYKFTVLTSKQGRGCHFMCWKQNQSQSKKKPTLRSKAHPPAMGDSMCTGKGGSWQRGPPSQVSNSTGIDETWRHRHLPCSFSRRQLRWNMGNVFILGCKSSVILRSCQRLPISPHSCSLPATQTLTGLHVENLFQEVCSSGDHVFMLASLYCSPFSISHSSLFLISFFWKPILPQF